VDEPRNLGGDRPVSDWRERAACLGKGDVMFPDPSDRDGILKARVICGGCRVQESCDQNAKANHERFGMWGGKFREAKKL
jgi:hypothetical protein